MARINRDRLIEHTVKILVFLFFFFHHNAAHAKTCPESANLLIVRGQSLSSLLPQGQEVEVSSVSCTPVHHGDFIVFKTGANKIAPVIKMVAGMAGDYLDLKPDGTVIVNGHTAQGPDGRAYIATKQGQRMLSLYKGVIPAERFLLLGKPGTLDSGRIGLVHLNQVVGVVSSESLPINTKRP